MPHKRSSAGEPGEQVVDHVSREGACDARLVVTLGAIVEQRPRRRRPAAAWARS